MTKSILIRWAKWLVVGLLVLTGTSLDAVEFAPITDAEKTLTQAPGFPNASAVVLFSKGRLSFLDYPQAVSSTFEVAVRIKILTEEGVQQHGEVEIEHSRFFRLRELRGRTVLSDGREIPLPEDAVFRETSSRSQKIYLTKIAFPGLEVGAIIDYVYVLSWDSIFFSEPWLFHQRLPTLLSEIIYEVPNDLAVQTWGRQTTTQQMQVETGRIKGGRSMRVWIENLPPIPDEPATYPFADLSSRVMVLPKSIGSASFTFLLLDNWKSTSELFKEEYDAFSKKDSSTKKKARELVAGTSSSRDRIDLLFRFVRDEIRTEWYSALTVFDRGADKALSERSATSAEKALLLQIMLDAVKIDSRLVWATNRFTGLADLSVANPGWFDRVLLRVELDGEMLYLDPNYRDLAVGHLTPGTEGTQAVLVHHRKPEILTLPQSTAEDNVRDVDLRFRLEADGRLSGDGSLSFTGQHAWLAIDVDRQPEDELKARQEWLEERFEGFEISDLKVESSIEERHVRLEWSFAQLAEDVLGDEASLSLSRPLGPVRQRFALPASQRLTPVQLRFPDTDQVSVELTWPEGWDVDVAPRDHRVENSAGAFASTVEIDRAGRTARYERRFVTTARDFQPPEPYAALRQLYETAEKSDAQHLVLVAR